MDISAGQSTLRHPLPMGWVRKLFAELQGNYGTRFLDMWRSGQTNVDGDDVGLQNAMSLWAERLGGFRDKPEAIRRVLDALPEHPPTLPKFLELCRACCPGPAHKALPAPNLTPAQIAERQAAAEAMVRKVAAPRYDHKAWARKLQTEWLAGRNLGMQQQVMGSEALRERWRMDNGKRQCVPIAQADAA